MHSTRAKYLLIILMFFCSCDLAPQYHAPNLNMPVSWQKAAATSQAKMIIGWWQEFNDSYLNSLVSTALENNADILIAYQNIKKAEAYSRQSKSFLFPSISAVGTIDKGKPDTNTNLNINSLAANLSYEIDLFGKIKNTNKVALSRLNMVKNTADTIKIAVASRVVIAYFHLLALQQNLIIAQKILTNQQNMHLLLQAQYREGDLEKIVLDEAKKDLIEIKRQKIDLEKQVAIQKNSLNVLVGKSPHEIIEAKVDTSKSFLDITVPKIIAVMPDQLLAQRPDIIAAEQKLRAANYNIGAVKADYLPDISLNTMIGVSNSRLASGNVNGWDANMGFSMPIIDFGRIDAKIRLAKAEKEIALLQYLQTVREAVGEVLDSMKLVQIAARDIDLVKSSDIAMRSYNNIMQTKYKIGKITQIAALTAKQKYLAEHMKLIQSKNNQLIAAVMLSQAFGRLN